MKIVYTYRVVCQKLSAPELGPYTTYGILAARDLRGLPAGRTVYLRRIVGPRPRRGPRTPLHRRPARPLPPAGRGRGCHRRVKPSAPKGSTRGEVRPFAGCPIAQGTPLTCCSRQAQSLPGCVCRAPFYAATVTCLSTPAHTPACQIIIFVTY